MEEILIYVQIDSTVQERQDDYQIKEVQVQEDKENEGDDQIKKEKVLKDYEKENKEEDQDQEKKIQVEEEKIQVEEEKIQVEEEKIQVEEDKEEKSTEESQTKEEEDKLEEDKELIIQEEDQEDKEEEEEEEKRFDMLCKDITLTTPLSAFNIFYHENQLKEKHKNLNKLHYECKVKWPTISEKEQEKYKQMENDQKEKFEKEFSFIRDIILKIPQEKLAITNQDHLTKVEKAILSDLNEIQKKIKPKVPQCPFRLFTIDHSKKNKRQIIGDQNKSWDTEKEKYQARYHRLNILYNYKKILFEQSYKNQTQNINPNNNGFYLFMVQLNTDNKPQNTKMSDYVLEEWDKLGEEGQSKYNKKANNDYEKPIINDKNKVFRFPAYPKHGFKYYSIYRFRETNYDYSKQNIFEAVKTFNSEWDSLEEEEKQPFIDQAVRAKKIYKKQVKEFEEFGYYTMSKEQIESRNYKSDLLAKRKRRKKVLSENNNKNQSEISLDQ